MQENVSLTVERLSGTQEEECRVTAALQIRNLLRDMAESGTLAVMYYDGHKDFIMTSLLEVGENGLWVEQGVDQAQNRRIAASGRLVLVSVHKQVKIQFGVENIRTVTHQGYAAFYIPLPAQLYRIQRRDFFRLALFPSERLVCAIPVAGPMAGDLEVPVMDISGGGVRLFYTGGEVEFVPGQVYERCRINLPEVGQISVALEVKSLVSIAAKNGQTTRRIGCEFKEPDKASGFMLQRFVTKVQRLRAAA